VNSHPVREHSSTHPNGVIGSLALVCRLLTVDHGETSIDRDFAKVIKRGDYHVFLTPRGDCRGLYVRSQGGANFEVRELAGGTSSAAFCYRIVGRRKDVKGHRRFAKIDTRLPVSRARRMRRAKMLPPTPARLRAFAARMQKEARARMAKRGRKGKGSAR